MTILSPPRSLPLLQVRPGEWHKARVTRNGPAGTLQLDDGEVVAGMSQGRLTELNLEMPLYLGGFK